MTMADPIEKLMRELLDSGVTFYGTAIEGDSSVRLDLYDWQVRARAALAERTRHPIDVLESLTADAGGRVDVEHGKKLRAICDAPAFKQAGQVVGWAKSGFQSLPIISWAEGYEPTIGHQLWVETK